MIGLRVLLPLLLVALPGVTPVMAASESDRACSEARERMGEQIKQARLSGDAGERALLETRLQALNERCRGGIALQPNHAAIERATRVATVREAQLREALGTGDPQVIEISKRRLDQARRELEAARR